MEDTLTQTALEHGRLSKLNGELDEKTILPKYRNSCEGLRLDARIDHVLDQLRGLGGTMADARATTKITAILQVALTYDYVLQLVECMNTDDAWGKQKHLRQIKRLLYSVLNFLEDPTEDASDLKEVRETVGGDSLMPRIWDPFDLRDGV